MNILILLITTIICALFIYLLDKYLKNLGLVIALITTTSISFILTFKYTTVSTLTVNSNSAIYISLLSSIYLLLEKNKSKEVSKIINLSFILNIIMAILMYVTSKYTQSLNDTIGINMTNVFVNNYRTLISFPLSLFISEKVLIIVYEKIKSIYDNLFISTVTAYLLIGLIDIILSTIISYYHLLDNSIIIKISLSTYMIRIIITVFYSLILIKINKEGDKS